MPDTAYTTGTFAAVLQQIDPDHHACDALIARLQAVLDAPPAPPTALAVQALAIALLNTIVTVPPDMRHGFAHDVLDMLNNCIESID